MKKLVAFFIITFIILSLMGCTSSGEIPPKNTLHEGITVTRLNLVEDHYGGQHILGEIRNDNSFPVQSIKLAISIMDANGKTVLKDARDKPLSEDSFNPFLSILFPGEFSGFDYSLSPLTNAAADYQVTFLSAVKMDSQKADVRIENAHIQKSMYGTSFFIGEIFNHGSQPARVEGLGVAVLGDNGQILDTNAASSLVQYLAPARDSNGLDRSTFAIPLRGSFEGSVKWQTYISAVITDTRNMPVIHLLESRHYVDSMGYFHLVGLIENESSTPVFLPLIGSLLDKDGNTLDSVEGYLPIDLQAGAMTAFDLTDWKVINHNINLQKMVKRVQIQIDPSQIFPSTQRYFKLFPSNIQESRNDQGLWEYTGRVNNFWPIPFKSIIVFVSIFSGNNRLVATNFQWIQPWNTILGSGRNASFDLKVFLDPTRDPAKYTYKIQALAEFPW